MRAHLTVFAVLLRLLIVRLDDGAMKAAIAIPPDLYAPTNELLPAYARQMGRRQPLPYVQSRLVLIDRRRGL